MDFHESELVELKEIVVEDVKKEIIAFANCDGGKLYIGIQDDGQIIGVEDAVLSHYKSVIWSEMLLNRI